MDEDLLTVTAHGSRRSYCAVNADALKLFLESRFEELRHLDCLEAMMDKDKLTRFQQASDTGNSKLLNVRSCPGFPVNTYEPLSCRLNGQEFLINPPDGSFLFITDWKSFSVPEDVVIVGIENMENFRFIRLQRECFESQLGHVRLLFVSRYPQSTDLRSWLLTITNRYVHFGDFDLAGISIFLHEFQHFLGDRSSFFIPSDINERLERGSLYRYNSQYRKFSRLQADDPCLQSLISRIHQYRRCYDQEGYILAKQ